MGFVMKKFLALAAVALSLSACSSPSERAAGGAVIGGATGAAIGGLATGRVGGAVVGGLIGAAGGAIIGGATAPCAEGYVLVRDRYGRDVCVPRRY
jgi:osmotically inducible lipoprotein OsmB